MNSNLSVQLLGKFKTVEKVVKGNYGPFVNLKDFQLDEQLDAFRSHHQVFSSEKTLKYERPKEDVRTKRKKRRSVTSEILCTTCCKSCPYGESLTFQDNPEVFRKFLEIVMISADHDESTFSKYQALPFCQNCHLAVKYLVATFRQMKELEAQAREMTEKVKSVIRLSKSIYREEKEECFENGWDTFREAVINTNSEEKNGEPVRKLKVVIQKHIPSEQLSEEEMSDWECDNNSLPVLSPAASLNELSLTNENEEQDEAKDLCNENKNTDCLKIEVEDQVDGPNHEADFSLECESANSVNNTVSKQLGSTTLQNNEKSDSPKKSRRAWKFAGMTSSHKKGLDNVRSFNNLPPAKLSQTREAIRWRRLRSEHPEMSQRELKAFIRRQNEERKSAENSQTQSTTTTPQKDSTEVVLQTDDTTVSQLPVSQIAESSGKSNCTPDVSKIPPCRRKGLANARSFINLPPEKLSQSPAAVRLRTLRAQHPEMSQRELKAFLRKQNAEKAALGLGKGLNHKQSFVNKPPEQLSQTHAARKFRNLRLQYPDKSIRELKEIQKKAAFERRGYAYNQRPKCETTEDGRIFYRNVEIKKLESGLYTCTKCEIGKTGSTVLNSVMCHINLRHIPRHKCSTCGKSFQLLENLNQHANNCLKGEEHMCHLCGMTFSDRSSRIFHIRVVHHGIKPFTCEHCSKSFGRRKDLAIHQRRHTGERPFVCHVCGSTFIEKQSMKKHIRNRHPGAEAEVGQEMNPFYETKQIQQEQVQLDVPPPTLQTSNLEHVGDDDISCSDLASNTVSSIDNNVTERI